MGQIMSIDVMQQMLGQAIGVTKVNAESVAVIMQDLEHVKNTLGGLVIKTNNNNDNIEIIKDRMTQLELNEEITETQAEKLNRAVKKRIAEILNYDPYEIAKYFRPFALACYKEMKKYHGMASSYRRTKKRDYQRLIDQIEAWVPSEGIIKLKEKTDERAEARRKAIEDGYTE